MSPREEKAILLFRQERYAQAEAEFRLLVAEEPDAPWPRQMLANVLSFQGKRDAALHEAREAVRLAPDSAVSHALLARVHLMRDELKDADAAAGRARELDPFDPDLFALRAAIRRGQDDWEASLAEAEQGLALDAEHTGCANARAQALTHLGRRDEAQASLNDALARDPEDDVAHCNMGWAMLHAGDGDRALVHFREALRIDPNYPHARQGYIEAMKARHRLYGLVLRALLAITRWPGWVPWVAMIAYLVLARSIASATTNPYVKLAISMANITLVTVGVFAVIASSLFTLTLRFDRDARRLLGDDQRAASNRHAVLLVLLIATLVCWPLLGVQQASMLAIVFGLLIPPVGYVYDVPRGAARRIMKLYVAAMLIVGLLSVPIVAMLLVIALLKLPAPPQVDVRIARGGLSLVLFGRGLLLLFVAGYYFSDNVAARLAAWHESREERRRPAHDRVPQP